MSYREPVMAQNLEAPDQPYYHEIGNYYPQGFRSNYLRHKTLETSNGPTIYETCPSAHANATVRDIGRVDTHEVAVDCATDRNPQIESCSLQPHAYGVQAYKQENEDHQERLIAQLQQEIRDLKSATLNYHQVEAHLTELQPDYDHLRHQYDDQYNKNESSLIAGRAEVENLIHELNDYRVSNQEIEVNQANLLEEFSKNVNYLSDLDKEWQHQHSELNKIKANCAQEKSELEHILAEQDNQRAVQINLMQQLDKLRADILSVDSENVRVQKASTRLRIENQEYHNKIEVQTDVIVQRDMQIVSQKQRIKEFQKKITEVKYHLKEADDQVAYFEDVNRKNQAAQSQLQRAHDYEEQRGRDLSVQLKDCQYREQRIDQQLKGFHEHGTKQESENLNVKEENLWRQEMVGTLIKQMNVVTDQNFKLSNELQRYLKTDDIVRDRIDMHQSQEPDAIRGIRQKVDHVIQKSVREVNRTGTAGQTASSNSSKAELFSPVLSQKSRARSNARSMTQAVQNTQIVNYPVRSPRNHNNY